MANETSQNILREKIREIVDEKWQRDKGPVLLSHLGGELSDKGVDYKAMTKGVNLSSFIRLQEDLFAIARHPIQKLKVGVYPADEDFEFEAESESETNSGVEEIQERYVLSDELRKSRGALYSFINELSKLPASEREGVIIPVGVLVKLMEGK